MSESNPSRKMRQIVDSKRCSVLILLLQIVAFIGAFSTTQGYWPGKMFWSYVTMFAIGLALGTVVLRLAFTRKVWEIVYKLNAETGRLYDAIAGFANVSLRVATLNKIFKWILRTESHLPTGMAERALFESGCDVGRDFAANMRDHLQSKGKTTKESQDPCTLLDRILRYDSTSGMGLFSLPNCTIDPSVDLRIHVLNAFSADTLGGCEFLRGYIKGVCESCFNMKDRLEVTEEACVARQTAKDGICKFRVFQR